MTGYVILGGAYGKRMVMCVVCGCFVRGQTKSK